ncbi:DUF6082 family protein [Streptomyces sp. NPDC050617]|uniref:DUF6082 family protein n=1 Tax=Streptomyces sp. NPDC050617 TaxID=3154628 RepID=UPI003443EF90
MDRLDSRGVRRALRVLGSVLAAGAVCAALSIAMTLVPGLRTTGSGNAGQAYGAAASSSAVLVLFYMAKTLRLQRDETTLQREELALQRQEMQLQRTELELQREEMRRSAGELHRSAEADLRRLHMDLLKMSIENPELAAVWPEYAPGLSTVQNRQYNYANLLYCHYMLAHRLELLAEHEVFGHLVDLVKSPVFRDYWEAGRQARHSIAVDTQEYRFARLVDEALRVSGPQLP